MTVVCHHLNTHTLKPLYKAFPPEEALRSASRLEIVYTPKQGSGANIAEMELSVFPRQRLNRRIPDLLTLRSQVAAGRHIAIQRQDLSTRDLGHRTHASNLNGYILKLKTERLLDVLPFFFVPF